MIGYRLNNYEIKSRLGEGGMGTVYLAEHPFMRRKAAVKVLRRSLTEDAAVVNRFMNEARAANAVRHPNIIDIMDVGTLANGVPYLMMEFLEGESLGTRLARQGRIPLGKALDYTCQIASALSAAHAAGIIHRDLKPDNLFIVRDGTIPGAERIKVLDFGIAKLRADVSGAVNETSNGILLGTPYYMSPEQCRGLATEIDVRTDVYALGVILYEMLCGAPPFQSQGAGELLVKHISVVPEAPRVRNPAIPPAVEAAIMKALAKRPAERFQSMDAFAVALLSGDAPATATATAGGAARAHEPTVAAVPVARADSSPGTGPGTARPSARRREEITTFRTGAAEVTPAATATATLRRGRWWGWAAGAAAVLVVGALSARFLTRAGAIPTGTLPARGLSSGGVPGTGASVASGTTPAEAPAPAAALPVAPVPEKPSSPAPSVVEAARAPVVPEAVADHPAPRHHGGVAGPSERSRGAGHARGRAAMATATSQPAAAGAAVGHVTPEARPAPEPLAPGPPLRPTEVAAPPAPTAPTTTTSRKAKRW